MYNIAKNKKNTVTGILLEYLSDSSAGVVLTIYNGKTQIDMTSRDIHENSLRWASYLYSVGIHNRYTVLIIYPLSPILIYLFIGSIFLGCLPILYGTPRTQHMKYYVNNIYLLVKKYSIKFLVIDYETFNNNFQLFNIIESAGCRIIVAPRDLDSEPLSIKKINFPRPQDVMLLQLTSGTTSLQKLCPYSHRMIIGHSQNQFGSFNISRKDVIVNWTPLYHDMGLMCNFIFAFIHRIRLVMIPPLAFIMHPFIWLKAMHAFKGTITWAPNFAFAVCVDRINLKRYPEIDLSHVRMFINASETISPGTFNKFYAKFSRCGLKREALTTSYGCAENTGTIAVSKLSKPVTIISIKRKSLINGKVELFRQGKVNKFSKGKVDLVSLGCALPGNKITIRRKDNVILSEMEIGEIVCKSNTTIKKYYKQRRLTTQNLKNGWLRTGDLGFLKNDELFFVGRIDEEIKIAGIKYFPSEIEQVINAINGVRKGCMAAFGVFDEALGTNRLVVLAESRLKNQEARERLVCNIKKEIAQRFGLTCYDVIVLPQGMLQKTTSGKKMHQEMKYRYLNGEFSVNKRLP